MDIDDIRQRLAGAFVPFKVRRIDGRIFSVPNRERAWVPPSGGKVVIVDQKGCIIIVQAPHIAAVEDEFSQANG